MNVALQQTEEPTQALVAFRLGKEWYGVPLERVQEVLAVIRITPLPSAPFGIAGVVNLRGRLMAVTDPKKLLGLPSAPLSFQSRLIVVAADGLERGLLVDEVADILPIPISSLEPALATFSGEQLTYVESICKWQERLIAVFRVSKLLELGKVA